MAEPQKKAESLSVGAKSHVESLARRHVYGYSQPHINTRVIDKGILVEQDSIDLYNEVFFKALEKNAERRNNTCLTGLPDLIDTDCIVDIKSCWNLETFPETKRIAHADAKGSGYDWQIRAYMWLFDKPFGEVAYCMVDTPDDLIREWDSPEGHFVSHIDPALRITTVRYERNRDIEVEIAAKVLSCKAYFNEVVAEIKRDHS